jgi:hypothetical protein
MTTRFDALSADAVLSDEDDAPVVAWSLDELDSDLDSVRSARGRTDDPGA